ncbi:MAG: GTP pyrophosphokinase family protein [Ruminococcaceae bacterium]|nr:GTP pyrophosphokinase family protein [Oscillospiraceae bacterium]
MEKDLQKSFIDQVSYFDKDKIFENMQNFQEVMLMYNCAVKEVRTKFEVLNDDLSVAHNRNPIEMIKTRIKKPQSIFNKLMRKNLDISMQSLKENINDVAGVRVICSFVDDIYEVAKMFISQDDITLIEVKDYIKNPKENGYRSFHIIVSVPVFFANRKEDIKVEVQFRTIAMDFWASLEHEMKYKKDIENADEIIKELKNCADIIASTDLKMQEINKKINSTQN